MSITSPAGNVTDEGYHKGLGRRQMQMIAIGGCIGTGLFLGAGSRLQVGGPSLAIVYAVCGVFAFLILRALGELAMHRPSSGSFVSYAREFLGDKAAYVAGWTSFLNWAMTGIADITAVALYMHFWSAFAPVPQWVLALAALCVVTGMNLIGVKYFGEMEFWFSLIKVLALIVFLIAGTVILGSGMPVGGHETGFHLITDNGGFFPHGVFAALAITQGVVFAYSGIELIGTAAGECENPREILPRAINSVIWRIAIFYIGSVVLLVCLLPWTAYHAGESPFVTFFNALGVPYADSVMNLIVLTAALSSLNSGVYSTSRVLRALALGGSAPRFLAAMNSHSVPYAGILLTVAFYLVGVALNYVVPQEIFEIVLSFAAIGIIATWAIILMSQIAYRRAVARGEFPAPTYKMPGAPFTSYITLVFLGGVLVLIGCDYPAGTITIAASPVFVILLVVGWRLIPKKPPMLMPETQPSAALTDLMLPSK
ncbi:amino acid permease [Acetobacter conturbans]|uniref:Amino acid permease n=1 Tax=Acetobacter conturbans TaxID=1737472 RepID=A0ABX0JUM0_9PROT|nr:amino acid permease [Acetobacter conturbans]NHN87196.1 amino acid permease [Acetobacter conturbans]